MNNIQQNKSVLGNTLCCLVDERNSSSSEYDKTVTCNKRIAPICKFDIEQKTCIELVSCAEKLCFLCKNVDASFAPLTFTVKPPWQNQARDQKLRQRMIHIIALNIDEEDKTEAYKEAQSIEYKFL
jgi:hypothetical protein